jgi:hypothetical protein
MIALNVNDVRNLAVALDPAILMQDVGLVPDPWQAEFLRCDARRILMLCGRQMGKSTVVGVLGLHAALYTPGSLVLCLSPSLRQSGELFNDKIVNFYNQLGRPVPPVALSATELHLANGSRIVSLPGNADTVRSFSSVHTLIVDEASRVDDDLIAAVSPMVAVSGGRLVLLSTPFGARGLFHEFWTEGDPLWARFRVTADACPRIGPEFLESELKTMGQRMFKQEYFCEFVATLDQLFSLESVEDAFSSEVEPFHTGGVL